MARERSACSTHLKSGSVTVKTGDRVVAGQEIARVGNSEQLRFRTSIMKIRTGFGIKGVRSLPPYFRGISVLGVADSARPGRSKHGRRDYRPVKVAGRFSRKAATPSR